MRRRRGFTLLEVLVVVALIGILSALAIPSYKRVRTRMLRARMIRTLQMMGEDQLLHQRDRGDFYPAGWSWGRYRFALKRILPSEPLLLEGQGITLRPGTRYYAYYIYRFEPFFPEPILYAFAARSLGNDLDGDPFPDLWIKVGSAPPQPYFDDLTDTRHRVSFR